MTSRSVKRGLLRRLMRLARREQGMTIAEVMIALLILAGGSLAVLNLITAAAHNSFRSEQSQVVNDRLQQEIEKIMQLPYSQIALTGAPSDSTNTNNPAWRVQGTSYSITQDGTQPLPLVYNGSALQSGGTVTAGTIDPTPTHFTSGDVGGTIYRYVVWRNDPSCPDVTCPGSQDMKRVVVAIVLDDTAAGGSTRHYQELYKEISNPATSPDFDPNPGPACTGGADCDTATGRCTGTDCTGGGNPNPGGVPWTFWLTDTPCDNSTRQPVNGDHLLHNTNGICSAGLRDSTSCDASGCPPGAPDLMVTSAPPLSGETPLWDYATDVEPPTNPGLDKGIQMPPPGSGGTGSGNGCLSSLFQPQISSSGALLPDPGSSRMQTIHKWLSPPMGNGFDVTLTGTGVLNLWTQTVNAASYNGRICVWLFERHLNAAGAPVDTPAVNLNTTPNVSFFIASQNPWPTGWTELHVPLRFSLSTTLGPNSRLGLAVQVERSGTSGGGMQFLYDEPSFDSRLQVTTPSALPF